MRRACVIALIPLLLASARADDKPTLQTIIDAWKAREKNTQSFDFRWWSKRFENGPTNVGVRLSALKGLVDPASVPDVAYIAKHRFLLDEQGGIRTEDSDREWSLDKVDYLPRTCINVVTRTNCKAEFMGGAQGFPLVYLGLRPAFGTTIWYFPLLMVYQPFNSGPYGFAENMLKLRDTPAIVDGKEVLVLDQGTAEVWVDPAKQYLPVRYTLHEDGVDRWLIKISYNRDGAQGWVPQSWDIEVLDLDGKSKTTESAKVIAFSINKPIDQSEFELDLSNGAYVNDNQSKEEYLLRPDGTRRRVKQGEVNSHNYEDLLNSKPDSK